MPSAAGQSWVWTFSVFRAEFLPLARLAVRARPDRLELFGDFRDQILVGGYDAGFEISAVGAFGPHSGAGKVGAAAVGKDAIAND